MLFSLPLLGLAAQIPFQTHWQGSDHAMQKKHEYAFKDSPDIFTPKDLVELARPGTGVANNAGDLVLVPVSKYSFEHKKCVQPIIFTRQSCYKCLINSSTRNEKSVYIVSLQHNLKAEPLQIPLPNGGSAFWLDSRTIAHVSEVGEGEDKKLEMYASSIQVHADSTLGHVDSPALIGTLPTLSATNFRYSLASGILVFSEYVYSDGNLSTVKEQDKAWENRGTTALVYDSPYERHWDHWIGPKKSSLFSVRLHRHAGDKWLLGSEYAHPLAGSHHVSLLKCGHQVLRRLTMICRVRQLSRSAVPTTLIFRRRILSTRRKIRYCPRHGTPNRMWGGDIPRVSWLTDFRVGVHCRHHGRKSSKGTNIGTTRHVDSSCQNIISGA